ncbi:MAG: hypothetical protein RIT30_1153 [Bacteroidota bacterium]|jgi:hypothetical protein
MNTIQVNILNPKADIILKDMEKQNLISIKRIPNKSLQSVLNNLRSNAKTAPSLKEITKEVELVRTKRYVNKNKTDNH